MNSQYLFILLIIVSSLTVSCRPEQDPTEYSITDKLNDNIQDPTPGSNSNYDSDKDIDDYVADCSTAQTNNAMIQQQFTVSFPAAIECNFNESGYSAADLNNAGNGPRIDGKIMARFEQNFPIQFPANATICDVDFNFPEQSMKYDDEIFLTMNNNIIMSSKNYAKNSYEPNNNNGLLINSAGLMQYKWDGSNGLYNLNYNSNASLQKYCLGISPNDSDYNNKCNIPPTDTLGQFKLDIPSKEIIKIGMTNNNDEINFGFNTIGDNDNGDCEHSAYSFDITIKYINR